MSEPMLVGASPPPASNFSVPQSTTIWAGGRRRQATIAKMASVSAILGSYSGTPFTVTASNTALDQRGNLQTADLVGEVRRVGIGARDARALAARARTRGFRAMQFNFVISTNERAIKTWRAYGFEVVGTLPGAFRHPERGFVDVFVMTTAIWV